MTRRPASFALLLLAAALLFFLIPPAWWLARDAWLLMRSDDGEEARRVIQRSIIAGGNRALEVKHLLADRPPAVAGELPVIGVRSWPPDVSRSIPTCGGRVWKAVGDAAGVRNGTSIRYPNRWFAVEEAKFRLVGRAMPTARLAMLDACVNATPFALRCARSYFDAVEELPAEQLVEELVRLEAVRIQDGKACWDYPEIVLEGAE